MIITSVLIRNRKAAGYLMAVPLIVFSATMGLGIIAMFALSALKSLPWSLPAGIMAGTIIVLSTVFCFLFLKEIKE